MLPMLPFRFEYHTLNALKLNPLAKVIQVNPRPVQWFDVIEYFEFIRFRFTFFCGQLSGNNLHHCFINCIIFVIWLILGLINFSLILNYWLVWQQVYMLLDSRVFYLCLKFDLKSNHWGVDSNGPNQVCVTFNPDNPTDCWNNSLASIIQEVTLASTIFINGSLKGHSISC